MYAQCRHGIDQRRNLHSWQSGKVCANDKHTIYQIQEIHTIDDQSLDTIQEKSDRQESQ